MLRAFAATRALLAAKTAVKEPVKVRAAVAKQDKKKVKKEVDPTKFQHSKFEGTTMHQIIDALPQIVGSFRHIKDPEDGTWHYNKPPHKLGEGLKFYRELWARYPEPSYWTIVKYRPKPKEGGHCRAWGLRTWRGVTEPTPREVVGAHKRDWRILIEPGTRLGPTLEEFWEAPPITIDSDPAHSTQLPEGLKGTRDGSWPYEWGTLGKRKNKGVPVKPEAEAAPAAEAAAEAEAAPAAEAEKKEEKEA